MHHPSTAQRQRGMSLVGMLFVAIVFGAIGLVGLRLLPIYTEYFGVVESMESLAGMPGMANQPFSRIRNTLQRKFDVNDVSNLTGRDVKIKREGSKTTVIARYEPRTTLLFNLDLIARMEKTVELRP